MTFVLRDMVGMKPLTAAFALLWAVTSFGGEWIWSSAELPERNSYVEFRREFHGDGRPVALRVAAGGEFCAEVNGQVATFGVYRDFPDRPAYNEVTVPTKKGANALAVGVFHSGNGFGSHSDGTPGFWAEVVSADGKPLAATGESGWQCRPLANYTFGKLPVTFGTLDWTYEYDAGKTAAEWRDPVAAAPRANPVKRPVAAPHLGEPIVARQIYREAGEVGFDLGTIACGWLEFGVKAPKGTRIRIKNREVLNDGRVKIFGDVQPGDYYVADGTAAVFRHRYRYYGCRYLAFEFPKDAKGVEVSSVKLIPAVYDGFETPPFDCDDEFFNRLHRACVKTLRLCWMGRHVSNVWREQAWYPYDLRFEALYDYTLWGMYGESAANLEQVGRGTLPNGYAPCVGPAVKDPEKRIWIPMYTFAWMTALTENCFYSGDDGLFRKFSEQIKGMLDAALAIRKDGLYLPPEGMMRWDYCDPALEDWVGTPNDPPNAFYNLYAREALLALAPLYRAHGEAAYAEKLERLATEIGELAVKRYWDAERGLFADRVDKDGRKIRFYSHIQYLFLAQGLVPPSERKAFIERLLKFDLPFGSFASLTFLCKGILAYGTDAQLEQFHAYVKRIYSPMIDGGFDTIWESPYSDYAGRNGCVCQGWAAFPAWYEAHVLLGVRPTKPGYAEYERKPRLLGGMKRVSGRVMTPGGPIAVAEKAGTSF